MSDERVVITGMGAISSIGLSVAECWRSAIEGISGVGPITLFDASEFEVRVACEVKNFQPELVMSPKEARRRDRFEQFSSVASREAINQAGLSLETIQPERIGVIISSSVGGLNSIQETITTLNTEGPRRISPFAIPMLMANGAAGLAAIDYGFKGPCMSVASACASGADALGVAWTMVKSGMIDVAVAGASEATITPVGMGAFDRVGAMSRRNDDHIPQPFDLNRDGLVMGEGAAVLVLEREETARCRGAEILAELAGYAATADAYHITAPCEDGSGGAQAIRQALAAARLNPEDVGYINAHGTGTPLNDVSETRAIKSALGDQAYHIPVSSTKSMTGHMMGATGALETVFCVMCVREGIIPPTMHYHTPDPECDLDYVPNQARPKEVRVALNNAFGFGGHNAVLVLKEY